MFSLFTSNDKRGGWGTVCCFEKHATMTEAKEAVKDYFNRTGTAEYPPCVYARIYDQETRVTIERRKGEEWHIKEEAAK